MIARNHDVERHGFEVIHRVVAPDEQFHLVSALGPVSGAGRRGVLGIPTVAELASSPRVLDLVRPYLRSRPFPVRAIYFDKSQDSNWMVQWHQDSTVALRERIELPGFGPWSTKDGIPHVQPPVELLQQMLSVRIHLDDADEFNGALRVLPGSHVFGRLSAKRIQELRGFQSDFICTLSAGDALLMRPLLLHASGRSRSARNRRVLHIEYAAFTLPGDLQWHEAAQEERAEGH